MNKYLEKIATYFYDQAGHRASHARDMGDAKDLGIGGMFSNGHYFDGVRGARKYGETFGRRAWKNSNRVIITGAAKGAVIGGAALGGLAYLGSHTKEAKVKQEDTPNVIDGIASGVILGGLAGASLTRSRIASKIRAQFQKGGLKKTFERSSAKFKNNSSKFHEEVNVANTAFKAKEEKRWSDYNKHFEEAFNRSRRSGAGAGGRSYQNHSGAQTGDLHSVHKDLEFPAGGFTTKSEATKHYKRMASKYHPDKGGNLNDSQRVNSAWTKFKNHPDGFEKLAGLGILERLYECWSES